MKRRPAETTTAAGAIATLIALALGLTDVQVIAALVVVIGLAPTAATTLIRYGGIRGVAQKLYRGHRRE